MTARKYFGTDGIRARVGDLLMTPDFVMRLGLAAGSVLVSQAALSSTSKTLPKVIIGRDTRLSGKMLESALEAGFSAAGVDVYLLGEMPTPGVAYLTRTFHASLGVVISASHNLFEDNGIKFFGFDGRKLSDALELLIERAVDESIPMVGPESIGRVYPVKDASGRYIEFCKSSVPPFFSLAGVKLVIDSAHGAGYQIAPAVFRELGAEVIEIGCQPDGLNINLKTGATDTQALQARVLAEKADLGLALDGDGDRVILVDHLGRRIDGDEILYVLALEAKRKGLLGAGGVVGTLMSNLALERALQASQIPFARTQVGDRYVMQALHERSWYLGGESSGHIIWLSSTTTGDGIIAGLQVLCVMRDLHSSLSELLQGYQKCPQVMINLSHTYPSQKLDRKFLVYFEKLQQEASDLLGVRGRVLIRPSGTEPVIRVMVEAESESLAQQHAREIAWKVNVFLEEK